MECELLRTPMISYRSLLYNTTVLYDIQRLVVTKWPNVCASISIIKHTCKEMEWVCSLRR